MSLDNKMRPRSFHRRRVVGLLFLGCAAWVLFTIARSLQLLSRGREIAQHSARFDREYSVGDPAHPRLTYLVMGDSTAAGWGAGKLTDTYAHRVAEAVASRGYRVRVVNVAVGGARLRDVLDNQLAALKSVRPQLITVSIGANDATHFTALREYSQELGSLLTALQNSGAKTVLLANTPDMYQAPALPLPLSVATGIRARRQNALLDAALRDTTIQRVDLYNEGKLIYRRAPDLYAADKLSSFGFRLSAVGRNCSNRRYVTNKLNSNSRGTMTERCTSHEELANVGVGQHLVFPVGQGEHGDAHDKASPGGAWPKLIPNIRKLPGVNRNRTAAMAVTMSRTR
jgi:lysophospholipase L1-like esterase